MKYKKIVPQIFIAKSEVELLKDALKKQAEEGNQSSGIIAEALEKFKIEELMSRRVGYWITRTSMGADYHVYENHIECSSCEVAYNIDLSWGDGEYSKMPQYAEEDILPWYCSNCGSLNVVAFRPSEYYSYLSYLEDEDEIRIKREALKDEVKKYMDILDFDLTDYVYSTDDEEEVLKAFELFSGDDNIPLFDIKGEKVYG